MSSKNTDFQRLELIRINNRIGVNEFLEKLSMGKTTYYNIRDGKSRITEKIIFKLQQAFPDDEYKWTNNYLNLDSHNLVNESEAVYSTISDAKFAEEAVKRFDNLMKISSFNKAVELEAHKKVTVLMPKIVKELLEAGIGNKEKPKK
ncbi:hypothetical protein [Aquimarina sp. 2201CG14-23]|uniref:hypothetical protein n=1 Tax=Aquimarina mycalae TaxID=3040073 RepID=UPI0024780437|nr:hypothetical protein [Aquimarina sp. 2201CG14-23]MDH7444652.1 hypothetical protein [Aquimarina sp. 2201CG14-23]